MKKSIAIITSLLFAQNIYAAERIFTIMPLIGYGMGGKITSNEKFSDGVVKTAIKTDIKTSNTPIMGVGASVQIMQSDFVADVALLHQSTDLNKMVFNDNTSAKLISSQINITRLLYGARYNFPKFADINFALGGGLAQNFMVAKLKLNGENNGFERTTTTYTPYITTGAHYNFNDFFGMGFMVHYYPMATKLNLKNASAPSTIYELSQGAGGDILFSGSIKF